MYISEEHTQAVVLSMMLTGQISLFEASIEKSMGPTVCIMIPRL